MSFPDYDAATVAVHEAMLDAYPGHIARRVAALEVDPSQVADSVEVGRRWLEVAYREQREMAPVAQRRSPLELFQAACAFPTERLEQLGIAAVERDDVATTALPGDRYDLAPASSQELGDDVWKVHVAWGVARAAEVAGVVPRSASAPARTSIGVAVITANLMDRTRIVDTAKEVGLSTVVWRNPGAVEQGLAGHEPAVAFVDLEHAAADDVVRLLAGDGVRTVAYGPHVDDIAMARARSLGATDVVPRSRLFTRLVDWLPRAI